MHLVQTIRNHDVTGYNFRKMIQFNN